MRDAKIIDFAENWFLRTLGIHEQFIFLDHQFDHQALKCLIFTVVFHISVPTLLPESTTFKQQYTGRDKDHAARKAWGFPVLYIAFVVERGQLMGLSHADFYKPS